MTTPSLSEHMRGLIDTLISRALVYGALRKGHPQEEEFLGDVKVARAALESAIAALETVADRSRQWMEANRQNGVLFGPSHAMAVFDALEKLPSELQRREEG